MTIKSRVKQWAFKRHILLDNLNSTEQLKQFLARFRNKYVSCDLVRVGGEGDGGYLLPNNFKDVKYCFSPGVSFTADFENELSNLYGIKSFMADASVEKSPIVNSNFQFVPKYLGSRTHNHFITLSDWIHESIGNDDGVKILQMDIESGEYDVLTYESADILASFSTLVIEFHGLQKLFESDFLRMFSAIFEKIYENFSICHVHPNNCTGLADLDDIRVPKVMEVTFIRNDLLSEFRSSDKITLPHRLDEKNVKENTDIVMPEVWWKD